MTSKQIGVRATAVLLGLLLPASTSFAQSPPTIRIVTEDGFPPTGNTTGVVVRTDPATVGAVLFQVGGTCSEGSNDGEPCFPGDASETACTDGGGRGCVGPDLGAEFGCETVCANPGCDPAARRDGTCKGRYQNDGTEGVSLIRACLLPSGTLDTVSTYAACVEGDGILSENVATVTWLAPPYATGGWKRGKGRSATHAGNGTIGFAPDDSGEAVGEYELTDRVHRRKCVFDTFSDLEFSCTVDSAPCTGDDDDAVRSARVHMTGTCRGCGSIEGDLVLEDNGEPGKNLDNVDWTRTAGDCTTEDFADAAFDRITRGNLQVETVVE